MRKTLTAILASAVIIHACAGIYASSLYSDAKILKAEYQGAELSRDRRNPTVLPLTDTEIPISLIGNNACASLGNASANAFSEAGTASGGNSYYNADGKFVYFLNDHKMLYVEDEVFDYYWGINTVTDLGINEFVFEYIPGSESPKYYITFNAGASGYIPPAGNEPAVMRAELDGVELSMDKRNPTPIPFANRIKIFGNSACVNLKAGIYAKYNGEQSNSGPYVYFNSSAIGACDYLSAPFDIVASNSGGQRYNEVVKLELSILTSKDGTYIYSDSPAYYVYFIEDALIFNDIKDDYWALPYIRELADNGVLNGYEDGTFRPEELVTRREFAKMMTLALGMPPASNPKQSFVDVNVGDWEFIAVETAKKYLTGYKQGDSYYFKGGEPAVREDMAVALVKALGLETELPDPVNAGYADQYLRSIFNDVDDISPNLRSYVMVAYDLKLINGYPDGSFKAQNAITRAETAALLVKVRKSDAMEKVTFD